MPPTVAEQRHEAAAQPAGDELRHQRSRRHPPPVGPGDGVNVAHPPHKPGGWIEIATETLLQNLGHARSRPGIAVLPFDNISGDPEQEYFADGLAEDLITELARTGALFVIARNTAFAYKKQAVEVPKLARELGVRFVLEGSVRRAGERVRITAQLIDGDTGGHIWAERFDRDVTDIFSVQDEITRKIVHALALSLEPGRANLLVRKSTRSVEAYDLFLRAREASFQTSRAGNVEAEALARKAIAIDPSFASPHAVLANVHMLNWLKHFSDDREGEKRRAEEAAETAISMNPDDPYGHWMASTLAVWMRAYHRAFALALKVLELDPTFVPAYTTIGNALIGLGRVSDALRVFDATLATGPMPPIVLHFRARALFLLGLYEEAAAVLRDRIERSPDNDISRVLLAAVCGHLGNIDEARSIWKELEKVSPSYSLAARREILPAAEFDLMVEGLAKAKLEPKF